VKAFAWYSRRYIRRHFHALRVAGLDQAAGASQGPLVLYANHSAWWDPLLALVLADHCFGDRLAFAPIDSGALARYGILSRMGFFGVDRDSRRGAARFLRVAGEVVASPGRLLIVTPQGRFADARERPLRFAAGLGHLAARTPGVSYLPVAVEYPFWEERLPEILVAFGHPFQPPSGIEADEATRVLEDRLAATQDRLAAYSLARDSGAFERLLHGGAGQGGIYDLWRATISRLRGRSFRREHGTR